MSVKIKNNKIGVELVVDAELDARSGNQTIIAPTLTGNLPAQP